MSQPGWGFPQQSWPSAPQPAGPGPGYGAWPVQAPVLGSQAQSRNRLRPLLFALIGLALLALAGLVVAGVASRPVVVQYQNEDYQVPEADLKPRRSRNPRRWPRLRPGPRPTPSTARPRRCR